MTRIAALHDSSRNASRLPERVQAAAARDHLHLAALPVGALFLALVAMSALPAARGMSEWFGWMPLWLLGMPFTALVALAVARRAGSRAHRRAAGAAARRSTAQLATPRRRNPPRQAVSRALDRAA